MFVRSCWQPRSDKEAYRLIDGHPWALIVSNGREGPLVTNLPLLLDRSQGERGALIGHIARANEHGRALLFGGATPTLAVFHGPSSYVTPSWYPNRDMPGTFYYMAVHCYGRVRIQTEAELERSLEVLNARMEEGIRDGWRMDEVEHSEITRRLPAIIGFELRIERMEAKFKLGQDEPVKDALAVGARLASSEDPSIRALAAAVIEANVHRSRPRD